MKCPVCNKTIKGKRKKCPTKQCGWEFHTYLTDISPEEKAEYEARLAEARRQYKEKTTPVEYSKETPVPEFSRDPFETVQELEERITTYPPLFAGTASLIKEEYDIGSGVFPFDIQWKTWFVDLLEGQAYTVPSRGSFSVIRDLARSIYEHGQQQPLFCRFLCNTEDICLEKIELYALHQPHQIDLSNIVRYKNGWKDPHLGMDFVWVEKSNFEMGDFLGDGESNEQPVHTVKVGGFLLGCYPVTCDQYSQYCQETGLSMPSGNNNGNYPVVNVTWREAVDFAVWLAEMTGFRFRLPTEAEWEYAARSCGKNEKYAGGNSVDRLAWHKDNSGGRLHKVGEKDSNGLGLYDMSGNVWEWCTDWYEGTYYQKSPMVDPQGPESGRMRVSRGGSWRYSEGYLRTAFRYYYSPDYCDDSSGFRLLRQP